MVCSLYIDRYIISRKLEIFEFIVQSLASEALLHLHTIEWLKFWTKFHITIDGNLELVSIRNTRNQKEVFKLLFL